MFLRGDRGGTVRTRLLLAYGFVLLATLVTLMGRAGGPSVPAAGGGWPQSQLRFSAQFLRWALGVGFPTLGLVRREPFAGLSARGAFGWFLETVSSVVPGNPSSLLAASLPVLDVRHRQAGTQGVWPTAAALSLTGPPQTGSLLVFGQRPVVAVYSTHSRDAFLSAPSEHRDGLPPVSSNPQKNITAVATALVKALVGNQVAVVQSAAVNDKDGMLGAYVHSAMLLRQILDAFPSVRYLIDVDRKAGPVKTVRIGSLQAAPITLVVGTANRLPNPKWQENLGFAKVLGATMQYLYPGLLAAVTPSPDRLNQNFRPGGSLTVEIGGENSTMAQEKASAAFLGHALAEVIQRQGTGPPVDGGTPAGYDEKTK